MLPGSSVTYAAGIVGAILILVGLPLVAGGLWLVALHGSPYYLIAGAFIVLSGILLVRGLKAGAQLYSVVFVGTLLWSFWEVGLDGWALLPRLLLPAFLGVIVMLPAVRRTLR